MRPAFWRMDALVPVCFVEIQWLQERISIDITMTSLVAWFWIFKQYEPSRGFSASAELSLLKNVM